MQSFYRPSFETRFMLNTVLALRNDSKWLRVYATGFTFLMVVIIYFLYYLFACKSRNARCIDKCFKWINILCVFVCRVCLPKDKIVGWLELSEWMIRNILFLFPFIENFVDVDVVYFLLLYFIVLFTAASHCRWLFQFTESYQRFPFF